MKRLLNCLAQLCSLVARHLVFGTTSTFRHDFKFFLARLQLFSTTFSFRHDFNFLARLQLFRTTHFFSLGSFCEPLTTFTAEGSQTEWRLLSTTLSQLRMLHLCFFLQLWQNVLGSYLVNFLISGHAERGELIERLFTRETSFLLFNINNNYYTVADIQFFFYEKQQCLYCFLQYYS